MEAHARELQRRADDAARRAEAFAEGGDGEDLVAGVLAPLTVAGYHVLHDRRVPGLGGNVDHVVVGPGGVAVVNAKNWAASPTVRDGSLWASGRRRDDVLDRAHREVDAVRAVLTGAGIEAPVRALLAFTRPLPPGMPDEVRGCGLVDLETLPSALVTTHAELGRRGVDAAAAVLMRALLAAGDVEPVPPPGLDELTNGWRRDGLPDVARLDESFLRRYVVPWRRATQQRLYVTGPGGAKVGWKDATSNAVHIEDDGGYPKMTRALLDGIHPGGLSGVVLPEVAAGDGFGRRLLMAVVNVNRDMLVCWRWQRAGSDRLYVHLLAAGKKPMQLGHVDLLTGTVCPEDTDPVAARKVTARQLLEYAWVGLSL